MLNKQTAVDIFHNRVNELIEEKKTITTFVIDGIWLECKEMQKQMTIKLYNDYENYLEEAFKNQCGGQTVIMSFGAFYEQTYGGGE